MANSTFERQDHSEGSPMFADEYAERRTGIVRVDADKLRDTIFKIVEHANDMGKAGHHIRSLGDPLKNFIVPDAENTFHILRRLVDEVRCKPNWKFHLADEEGALRLYIFVDGRDNFDHSKPFRVNHVRPVPTTTFNEKSWRRWILDQCLAVEAHEICESLRFGTGDNEVRPFLPTHGPGEDPYAVREYRNEDDAFTTQDGSLRKGPGPYGVRK